MRFSRVKKDSEVQLPGIDVQVERHDSSINSLTFVVGGRPLLKVSGSYGVEVLIPAPPQMVKRYQVIGSVAGVTVNELVEDSYDAKKRVSEIQEHDGVAEFSEVEVPEEE